MKLTFQKKPGLKDRGPGTCYCDITKADQSKSHMPRTKTIK